MKKESIIELLAAITNARSCIREAGEWVSAPCPFAPWTHAKGRDSRASFGIAVKPSGVSHFNCLACGEHGSLTQLVNDLTELRGQPEQASTLLDLVEREESSLYIPDWDTVADVSQILTPVNEEEFDDLFSPAIDEHRAVRYFRKRGLHRSSLEWLDLRWDDYRKRILFKVKQDDMLYGASGRSVLDRPKNKVRVYSHKSSLFLVGEEKVDTDDTNRPLVVIEGLMGLAELDRRNLYSYADPVAIQGSHMSTAQAERIATWGKPVVLLLDNDAAGRKGIYGGLDRKGKYIPGALDKLHGLVDCYAPAWPKGITEFLDMTPSQIEKMVMDSWSF